MQFGPGGMVSVNGALCFQLWREWSTNKAKSIQCFQASPLSYVELRDLGGEWMLSIFSSLTSIQNLMTLPMVCRDRNHINHGSIKVKTRGMNTLGNTKCKSRSQEIPRVTGKFGLGVQNEAGQRLTEFCHENARS